MRKSDRRSGSGADISEVCEGLTCLGYVHLKIMSDSEHRC
jgi:hypothetical protein